MDAQAQDEDKINVNSLDLDVEQDHIFKSCHLLRFDIFVLLHFIAVHNNKSFIASQTLNPTIENLLNLKEGITRYRIVFLPEFHFNDPIKRFFTDKEWIVMESRWRKVAFPVDFNVF